MESFSGAVVAREEGKLWGLKFLGCVDLRMFTQRLVVFSRLSELTHRLSARGWMYSAGNIY